MKPNWSFAFGMLFVLLCGLIAGFFAPEPLILYPEHTEILTVSYRGDRITDPVNEEALLQELGAAEGHRRSETFARYPAADVFLEIGVLDHKQGNPRHILLGNLNICYETEHKSWDIMDAENLYNRLTEILGITSED